MEQKTLTGTIPEEHAGWRLDQSLAKLFEQFSRSRIQAWIDEDLVTVDGFVYPRKYVVKGGEQIVMRPSTRAEPREWEAENISLDIVYEDEQILIINKPAGLVMHPGAGNLTGTLLNALLHYISMLETIPRAGIVHRLDKNTSGLLVVAKTLLAHSSLAAQLQKREVRRQYLAIVRGQLVSGGTISQPIGRHAHDRTKMAITERGKHAVTHYTVLEKFQRHTLVEATLETGRTHQIRVHFAAIKHPLVGDSTYAPRLQRVANVSAELNNTLSSFQRQALHAYRLCLMHPVSHQEMCWQTDLPEDFMDLLHQLRKHSAL